MAALGIKKVLALGQPTLLNDGHATGTGTLDFYCPVHTNAEGDFSAIFQVVGTLTTLTAALQVSLDGGNTFNDLVASASFLTTSAPVAGFLGWRDLSNQHHRAHWLTGFLRQHKLRQTLA